MGTTLQETPSGNRLHIGIFGKTNSGKVCLYQCIFRTVCLHRGRRKGNHHRSGLQGDGDRTARPCVLIDTAGFDDEGELGACGWKRRRWLHRKRNWH